MTSSLKKRSGTSSPKQEDEPYDNGKEKLNSTEVDRNSSERHIKNDIDVKVFPYKHALPVHTMEMPSILAKNAPALDYRGFLTLAMLLLLATNVRLVVENFLKYGVLLAVPTRSVSNRDWGITFYLFSYLQLSLLATLIIEKLRVPNIQNNTTLNNVKDQILWWLHIINIVSVILIPTYVVFFILFHPFVGCLIQLHATVNFLKMISFVATNKDLRLASINEGNSGLDRTYSVQYPSNLSFSNYYYFMLAPTLCYQPTYPRSARIRRLFLAKRVGEFALLLFLMYFLVVQYAIPTLRNSRPQPLNGKDLVAPPLALVIERVLKLSTISVVVWLLGFYAIFHSFLNAVMYFGDRNFYLPWWNSASLAQYWRLWNQPVHHWMKRHVYVPCVSAGYHPNVALGATFLFSAIFHETLFGIPVHSVQGYAFWGMLGQIPLIMLTEHLVKVRGPTSSIGNVIFWIAFCIIGQPLLVVLYYYDWTRRNPPI